MLKYLVILYLFLRCLVFLEVLWNNEIFLEEFIKLLLGNINYVFMIFLDLKFVEDVLWMRS